MPQEILSWLIALFVVAGFLRVGVLISGIGQRRKMRRIQQGIAEYLFQKAAAKV